MKPKKKKQNLDRQSILYKINQSKIFTLENLAQKLEMKDKNALIKLKLLLKTFEKEGLIMLRGDGVYFSVFKKDGMKHGVIGYESPRQDFGIICERFKINPSFSKKVIQEAEKVAAVDFEGLKNRKDYRSLPVFTIDGADAKDLDDAVSLIKEGSDYRLFVHIADVSFYVREGSALDKEAFARGTSIYLADNVIPMLPKVISNGACSLNPHEDKLVFTAEVVLSERGEIKSYAFYEGIISSARRFTYDEVEEILKTGESPEEKDAPLIPMLLEMGRLIQILKEKRIKEGSLDFEIPEVKIICDSKGRPVEFKPVKRLSSHQLIEELMLTANRAVALFLSEKKLGIYRVHESPDSEKLDHFIKMANLMGHALSGFKNSQEIQAFLEKNSGKPESYFLNTLLLRCMKQAYYHHENFGHFGLGFSHYTHFTSPIRRYPDLLAHRLMKKILKLQSDGKEILHEGYREEALRQASERERNAVDMERAMQKRKAIHYLKDHINEQFYATVSGVTEFGVYAALDALGIEGMVVRNLLEGFLYDPDLKEYRKKKHTLKLGTRIPVRLLSLNLKREFIDFQLAEIL